MKKRKSRKQNKNAFFILLLLFAAFLCFFYLYSERESVREFISESAVLENMEADVQSEKLVKLPPALEIPLCPAKEQKKDHEIRNFENYSVCYRESYEQAEWSAYMLCDFQLEKKASRSNDFRPDPEISTASSSPADYKKSGYDRGHLTPAADMAFSEKAMNETFFMSNMSPQAPRFNRGIWKELEAQVRTWAEKFGRVYVVSGPLLSKSPEDYESIGENRVSVPEYFYKVILVPLYADGEDRSSMDDAASVCAVGFVIPNKSCEDDFWNYACSIDQIEKMTGLDFYSALEDKTENRAEASFDRSLW